MQLTVTVAPGSSAAPAALGLLAAAMRSYQTADAVGAALEQTVNIRLSTKTAPSGRPWAPWAAPTARARAKSGRGTLMMFTGRMAASLTRRSAPGTTTVGFGVPYADQHETGTRRMPARPLLFDNKKLSASDESAALAAALAAIRSQVRGLL